MSYVYQSVVYIVWNAYNDMYGLINFGERKHLCNPHHYLVTILLYVCYHLDFLKLFSKPECISVKNCSSLKCQCPKDIQVSDDISQVVTDGFSIAKASGESWEIPCLKKFSCMKSDVCFAPYKYIKEKQCW